MTTLTAAGGPLNPMETKDQKMTYGEVREFLSKYTDVVELSNASGARVAVCPAWQGRVMTSTCDGPAGASFGFINREFIAAGKLDPHFNNYGGEERMWLSPEGGQFSLWFAPGAAQHLDNWYTPRDLNEGPWKVFSGDCPDFCGAPAQQVVGSGTVPFAARGPGQPLSMTAGMKLQNTSGTHFQVEVARTVRLISEAELQHIFGASAAARISASGAKSVAYETDNRLTNRGEAMTREQGLINIWMLGMMNSGPGTVVIVPYNPGSEAELGPAVTSDYFGTVPAERVRILPEAVLLRADGNYRSKLGVSQQRVRNVLGSIDFLGGVLTLVQFSMPADPAKELYMSNQWSNPLAEPYRGDVLNSYNDGPPAPGKKQMGAFYEIESLSPARELKCGESLSHQHRTVHVQADEATLAALAKDVLGVDLAKVKDAMSL